MTTDAVWAAKHARCVRLSEMVRGIAQRLGARKIREARTLAAKIGLDPTMAGLHAHNALLSYEAGQPWPEIDYGPRASNVRRVLWLWDDYSASQMAERIMQRAWAS